EGFLRQDDHDEARRRRGGIRLRKINHEVTKSTKRRPTSHVLRVLRGLVVHLLYETCEIDERLTWKESCSSCTAKSTALSATSCGTVIETAAKFSSPRPPAATS